jgi:prephenate dehydrogenase
MNAYTTHKETLGLIGYGRFGKTLHHFLQSEFAVKVFDLNIAPNPSQGFFDLATVCKEKVIYVAVPIHQFEQAILQMAPLLQNHSTVIDVCSVKEYPVDIMQRFLPAHIGIIASHPMFGPDSANISSLKMMLHSVRDPYEQYVFCKGFWLQKGLNVIEMSPAEHDRDTAYSQALTHLMSRLCQKLEIKKTAIDTASFQKLTEVVQTITNDHYELSIDLLRYNRYAKEMLQRFGVAYQEILVDIA